MTTVFTTLKDNKGARHRRKTLGRGIGSGHGKTSCRGGKGQTARSGVALNGFEGGQMPIYRRLPKRGFTNFARQPYEVINLARLCDFISRGKLAKEITLDDLKSVGLYRGKHPAKLLKGTSDVIASTLKGVSIIVHKASATATSFAAECGMKVAYQQ